MTRKIDCFIVPRSISFICADCNKETYIAHGIPDANDNVSKIVCDECYKEKYHEWLYGNHSQH